MYRFIVCDTLPCKIIVYNSTENTSQMKNISKFQGREVAPRAELGAIASFHSEKLSYAEVL